MGHKHPELFKGLIIENTFTSISDMAHQILPFFKYLGNFKKILLKIGWNSDKLVPHIELPILYITGDADEIVPYIQTLTLH